MTFSALCLYDPNGTVFSLDFCAMRLSVRKRGSASGKVINVPDGCQFEELVTAAREALGLQQLPCVIKTDKGDRIETLAVLRDGDVIYVETAAALESRENVTSASNTNVENALQEISSTFGPYTNRGPFTPTNLRRSRGATGRRHCKGGCVTKRLLVVKDIPLPAARTDNNFLMDSQIIFDRSEDDVRHHILQLLSIKMGEHYQADKLNLLRCEGKRLKESILPPSFRWTGDLIAKFVGQGCLYVQLKSEEDKPEEDKSEEDDLPDILNSRVSTRRPLTQRRTPERRQHLQQPSVVDLTNENPTTDVTHSRQRDRLSLRRNTSSTAPYTLTSTASNSEPTTAPSTSTRTTPSTSTMTALSERSINVDFLEYPANVLDLYEDSELYCVEESERRDSDVVTVNTGPAVAEILMSLTPQQPEQARPIRILIRRGHVLNDLMQRMQRCTAEQLNNPLHVTFVGEAAEDEGGPKREMFTLFLQELATSRFMCMQTLAHNGEERLKKSYRSIGWVIVLSLLYGGPAPSLFSQGVVRFILGRPPNTGMEDLGCLRDNMLKLMSMSTEEMRSSVDTLLEDRFAMGYVKPTCLIELDDLQTIVNVLSYHVSIESCKTELEQLIEGLGLLGFINKARQYPGPMSRLLEIGDRKQLTADCLQDLFQVRYSDVGTNMRGKEEAVMIAFTNLLIDIEAGSVSTQMDNMDGQESVKYTLKLCDLLFFVTGCTDIPPLGFRPPHEPQLVFDHTRSENQLLTANTCACMLFIPMHQANTTYEGLMANLTLSVCGSPGFGQR